MGLDSVGSWSKGKGIGLNMTEMVGDKVVGRIRDGDAAIRVSSDKEKLLESKEGLCLWEKERKGKDNND
jgi:hypothetical protein